MSEIKPIEINWPEYHYSAMGCGLEDRGIHDRYDAMLHGWECAVERCAEAVPDEPMVLASEAEAIIAAKDAEIEHLRDALKPFTFGNSSLNFDRFDDGNTAWVAVDGAGSSRVYFFVGDVLRARAALSKQEGADA